jgi:hypothetical protein
VDGGEFIATGQRLIGLNNEHVKHVRMGETNDGSSEFAQAIMVDFYTISDGHPEPSHKRVIPAV